MDYKWQFKKKKKPLRIQTKFSHHSKELSAPLKTTERLHFHGLLLPNRRQWIKALNPSVLFDLGNETKHWHLNMTRSEILQSLYFGSGFPLLATESYTLIFSQVLRGRGAEVSTREWGGWWLRNPASCLRGYRAILEYSQSSMGGRIFYTDLSAFIRHLFLTYIHKITYT